MRGCYRCRGASVGMPRRGIRTIPGRGASPRRPYHFWQGIRTFPGRDAWPHASALIIRCFALGRDASPRRPYHFRRGIRTFIAPPVAGLCLPKVGPVRSLLHQSGADGIFLDVLTVLTQKSVVTDAVVEKAALPPDPLLPCQPPFEICDGAGEVDVIRWADHGMNVIWHDHAGPDVPDMILMSMDKGLDHSLRHSGLAKLIGAVGNRAEGDEKVGVGHPCRRLVV